MSTPNRATPLQHWVECHTGQTDGVIAGGSGGRRYRKRSPSEQCVTDEKAGC
ncbi:hypothetical protein LPB41_28435 [Thalassospira sp. MA62]|nr:hypothetical protein [Thalassospira sp. MA62]